MTGISLLRRLKIRLRRLPIFGLAASLGVQAEILQSSLFDAEWYLTEYPDVKSAGVDPLRHFAEMGWRENRNPNALFNTWWYREANPDVAAADVNPLLHYIRSGALELRDASPEFRSSEFQDSQGSRGVHHLAAALNFHRAIVKGGTLNFDDITASPPRVLIIAELSIPQCKKYRVDQKVELLILLGFSATVIDWREEHKCKSAINSHSLIIFYRVPAVQAFFDYIEIAKKYDIRTFWEVDDLIFDPNEYVRNSNLADLDIETKRNVLAGVPLYRTAMLCCDEVIASTASLAEAMRSAGASDVHIVENALDGETLRAAEGARLIQRPRRSAVIVCYGSGTNTHDQDFAVAVPGLLRAMDQNKNIHLRIIGDLKLSSAFGRYGGRVQHFEKTDYKTYLQRLAECDIAIAPLEATSFNDSKSNIKFIEAAIVGLPII